MTDVITRSRVLMLVISSNERDAVIDAVGARTERRALRSVHTELTIYALGKIGRSDILLAQMDEAGIGSESDMADITATALRYSRPDYVMLVGTCHGLRPDDGQRLGDVLVADRVVSMHPPASADWAGGTQVLTREIDAPASALLLERCRAAQAGWSRYRAGIHVGLLVCTGTPVDSPIDRYELRARHPQAVGGEAGGAGALAVVAGTSLDWVVVKAIAGWGRGTSDESLDIAARNAVDFAVHAIASGTLQPRQER